jgi:hypothetical protein
VHLHYQKPRATPGTFSLLPHLSPSRINGFPSVRLPRSCVLNQGLGKDLAEMKWIFLSMVSTLALLCLAGPDAQAEQLTATPSWSYSFAITPNSISSKPSGNGTIQFYGSSNVEMNSNYVKDALLGTMDLVGATPITARIPNGSIWMGTLTVSDAFGMSKPLTLMSTFAGASPSSPWSNLNTSILQAASTTLPTGWSVVAGSYGENGYAWTSLGGNTYTFTLGGIGAGGSPPAFSDPNTLEAFIATVQVDEKIPSATPEPSTLVLSFFGLGIAGLASWRQRRRT